MKSGGTRTVVGTVLVAVVAVIALAMCGEEAPDTVEPVGSGSGGGAGSSGGASSGGTAATDPVGDEAPAPEPAQASWSDDTYELTATATGPYAVGAPSTFEVRLTPRGEYHVNRNYPWSVTVTPPAAVLVPTATFDSTTAAEMTDTIARFVVPFTPSAAGTHEVTAAVDFGICREEACIFQMHNVLVTLVAADGVAADGVPGGTAPALAPGAPAPGGAPAGEAAPPPGALPGATSAAPPIPAAAEAGGRS